MRKKIIMFFGKEKSGPDPFSNFGPKRLIYHYFFQLGQQKGLDMFVVGGENNYLGGLRFKNPLYYDGHSFKKQPRVIQADAVFDRSATMKFPPKYINTKVLNCSSFKILCHDKNLMRKMLGKFMPKSFLIKSHTELLKRLNEFKSQTMVVLKPTIGLGGKGILIKKSVEIKKTKLNAKLEYLLQEYIDTSSGIPNLVKSHHDLRVVIVNGHIIWAHIRTPMHGSLLANVSQGGKIKEISLSKLPNQALEITKKIQSIIDKKFFYPLYSIDFGIDPKGQPFVFELNDQIGFPKENMKKAKFFIETILESLTKKII